MQTQTMSARSVYMEDGETETEEFTVLKKCLECQIEHYHDITKAKLVSTFFSCYFATYKPLSIILQLFC